MGAASTIDSCTNKSVEVFLDTQVVGKSRLSKKQWNPTWPSWKGIFSHGSSGSRTTAGGRETPQEREYVSAVDLYC